MLSLLVVGIHGNNTHGVSSHILAEDVWEDRMLHCPTCSTALHFPCGAMGPSTKTVFATAQQTPAAAALKERSQQAVSSG